MAMKNRHQFNSHLTKEITLTSEQRRRFAERANKVDEIKEKLELEELKRQQNNYKNLFKKKLTKSNNNNIRYSVWTIVFGIFCLWLMYMSETGGF